MYHYYMNEEFKCIFNTPFINYVISDLKVIDSKCIVCWNDTQCHVLSCFKTHVMCIDCIKKITDEVCPMCREDI